MIGLAAALRSMAQLLSKFVASQTINQRELSLLRDRHLQQGWAPPNAGEIELRSPATGARLDANARQNITQRL